MNWTQKSKCPPPCTYSEYLHLVIYFKMQWAIGNCYFKIFLFYMMLLKSNPASLLSYTFAFFSDFRNIALYISILYPEFHGYPVLVTLM